jgi:hypothetical protein
MSNEIAFVVFALIGFGGPIAYGFWLMWKYRRSTPMSRKQ